MIRSRVRLAAAALVVAAVVAALVPAPAHASAGVPLPGPVDEIADIPERLARSVTSSPVGDSVVRDMMEAQKALIAIKRAQDAATTVAAAPKVITAPAVLARGAGGPLTALMASWAVASNGTLALVGVANGTDYEQAFCAQPAWYQGTTSFVNMGFAPDCSASIPDANTDIQPGLFLNYGGATYVYTGLSSNGFNYCYSGSGTPSAGSLAARTTTGGWEIYGSSLPAGFGFCPQYRIGTSGLVGPALSIVTGPSNTVLAEMAEADGDPSRTPRCTIEWEDDSVTTGTGYVYQESTGISFSAAGLGCEQAYVSQPGRGPDLLPRRISVGSTNDDTGVITEISDQEVPEFGPDDRRAFETGNGRGLVLEKVAGTVMTSCMTWAADCSGWWEATDEGTTTGTYRCTYAGNEIALVECGAYRYTFDTQTSTPTITDPATGTQTPWTTQPSTGNSISPGTGPGTGANPTAECVASGWSAFNPIEWVLTPVKCALVWAFVPRQAKIDETTARVEDSWNNSAPGKLAATITGISPALAELDAGSCGGLILPVPKVGAGWAPVTENRAFLPACPGDFFAPWAPLFYWLITGGLVVAGFFMVKRWLDRFVGFA